VPPEALPRLYDTFYRVPAPGATARRGTGIGLAVVRGLVAALGGTVRERSSRLGGLAIDVQLGDYDSRVADMVQLAVRIRAVARDLDLPFAIETHRDTFTETPEATVALARGYRRRTGETLPLCLDHSHFAVVRHLARDAFWTRLSEPAELLDAATQFHLRPFNGHHCQVPVLDAAGRRTPEYRDWLVYAAALFAHLRAQPATNPVLAVPELGHANPTYGLSCFGDTWLDAQALARDLRRLWREAC
jgi:hypothetical protein